MNNSDEDMQQELSALMKETVDEIVSDYHSRFSKILDELGLFSDPSRGNGSVPLEVWTGIAQALADASRV